MVEDLRYPIGEFNPPVEMNAERRASLIDEMATTPSLLRKAVAGLAMSLLIVAIAALPVSESSAADQKNSVHSLLLRRSDNYNYGGLASMGVVTKPEVLQTMGLIKDEEHALIDMEQQWNEALRTHNPEWFEKNLANDFTDISSGNGALSTKAEDIANLKVDKTVYESLELSNLKARIDGNAGVVTGVNHIKGHDGQGQNFDVRLSFTDTYVKRHGRWQAWASQHTRVKP